MDAAKDDKYLEWEGKQNFYAHFDERRDWKEQYKDQDEKSIYENMVFPKLSDPEMVAKFMGGIAAVVQTDSEKATWIA